ncbi:MAG: cupin domain-containing protein [Thermodesulfobacteriota bacterium]
MKTSRAAVSPYVTRDGSLIRELMHPAVHGNHRLSLAEASVAPGAATALHRHLCSEEIYHVLDGTGWMILDGERFSLAPGDTICIAPGLPHRVENDGRVPLRILCCCTPPYAHEDTELIG